MNTGSHMKVGVVLGRFQLPRIHPGHRAVIEAVLARHEYVVIAIALTPVFFNKKDPLPGPLRKALLRAAFPDEERVKICFLHNNPVSNQEWSKEFDRVLAEQVGEHPCVIYGGRDNSLECYSGKHETWSLEINIPISATEVREKISKADFPKDLPSLELFAEGLIYATQQVYPVSYSAVDLAVLRRHPDQLGSPIRVLLCGKKTDPVGKWRFPGGFVDPADLTVADAAEREGREELGEGLLFTKPVLLGDSLIDDWRYRGTEHSIRSMFHVAQHMDGEAVASDDIDRCEWFEIDQLDQVIIPAHQPLVEMLRQHVAKL